MLRRQRAVIRAEAHASLERVPRVEEAEFHFGGSNLEGRPGLILEIVVARTHDPQLVGGVLHADVALGEGGQVGGGQASVPVDGLSPPRGVVDDVGPEDLLGAEGAQLEARGGLLFLGVLDLVVKLDRVAARGKAEGRRRLGRRL